MAPLAARLQHATPWERRRRSFWWFPLARASLLVALFLLPVQMRAGAADAHPHALLQLILDVQDGSFDHHHGTHPPASHGDTGDAPEYAEKMLTAGTALLAPAIVILRLSLPGPGRTPATAALLRGRWPELEPPPPRGLPR